MGEMYGNADGTIRLQYYRVVILLEVKPKGGYCHGLGAIVWLHLLL